MVSDVLVVGAGIVGTSVAAALADRGVAVLVLEAGPPGEGSSDGNAGHLVPSHVVPFAAPGMVRTGLRSLGRRDGAFALSTRLRQDPSGAAGWLTRFVRSANQANVRRAVPALTGLLDRSLSMVSGLAADGADLDFSAPGLLQVFSSRDSWAGGRHEARVMRDLGYPATELSARDVFDLEPQVVGALGGVLLERDGRLDPALLLTALRARAETGGARFVRAKVLAVAPGRVGVAVSTDAGPVRAERLVIAAGVWTPELVRRAGGPGRLPIRAAKGYSTTVSGVRRMPTRPLLLMDQRLAVNPLARGLRISGRFELTVPTDRSVRPDRVHALVTAARPALGLPQVVHAGSPWSGLRPATPDGLPIIGPMRPGSPVVIASGHGMLGTSMGPATGELVADLLEGADPLVDPEPLAPGRFTYGRSA
jgi:D-amino-acid dehydrogenase